MMPLRASSGVRDEVVPDQSLCLLEVATVRRRATGSALDARRIVGDLRRGLALVSAPERRE